MYPPIPPYWLVEDVLFFDEPDPDDEPDPLDTYDDDALQDAPLLGWIPRNASPPRQPPARRRAQRGVEFVVEDAQGFDRSFRSYNDAAGFAVGVAAASGKPVHLDVLVMSRDGAAERIQISAKSVARSR